MTPEPKQCLGFAFSTYSRCQSRAPRWHGFCHRHRFEPLLLALGFFGFVANVADWKSLVWDASPATEKQAGDALAELREVKRTNDQILSILKGANDINHDRLKRDYPLGYSLFYAVTGENDPHPLPVPSSEVEVDWSQVRVENWDEPGILFLWAPGVRDARTGVGFEEIVVGLPRHATAPTRLFGTDGLTLFGEMLESPAKALVFVLGLRRETR